jgi:hypothetical protein
MDTVYMPYCCGAVVIGVGYMVSEDGIQQQTENLIKNHKGDRGVVLVTFKNPSKQVTGWLTKHGWTLFGQWKGQYGEYNMHLYALVLSPPVEEEE